jgi:hypothetical protein
VVQSIGTADVYNPRAQDVPSANLGDAGRRDASPQRDGAGDFRTRVTNTATIATGNGEADINTSDNSSSVTDAAGFSQKISKTPEGSGFRRLSAGSACDEPGAAFFR